MSKVFRVPIVFTGNDINGKSYDELERFAESLARTAKWCVLDIIRAEKRKQMVKQ